MVLIKKNKQFRKISILLIYLFLVLLVSINVIAPPTPHSVSGIIYHSDGITQVPSGTNYLVNNTNSSEFIQDVTDHPVKSGQYAVSIRGEDGDYLYTKAWNDTHLGITNYILLGNMNNLDVILNLSRIEQNVTIIDPLDSETKSTGLPFNVTANITALGGSDNSNCNATIFFSNPSILSLANGETALHQGLSFTLGTTENESWELNATVDGFSNITVEVVCENQTYFTKNNSDTVYDIQFSSNTPQIISLDLEDDISAPLDEILLSPNETIKVWCNGTANDADGFLDLNLVQGVLYANTSNLNDLDNRSIHYTDVDCSLPTWNTDGKFSCGFDVYFFAQPVNWTCFVNVSDKLGNVNNSNDTSIIQELLAIDLSQTVLDFGSLQRGYESGTNDFVIDVWNLGNVVFDIIVDTYNSTIDSANAMDCTIGQLSVNNLRFNETPNIDYTLKVPVPPAGGLQVDFNQLPQRASLGVQGTSKESYWGIEIPSEGVDDGGLGGSCSGFIRYEAVLSS